MIGYKTYSRLRMKKIYQIVCIFINSLGKPCKFVNRLYVLSVDYEIPGRSPKIGERTYVRSPIFGYSFGFREALIWSLFRG
jgi:hypothetical protein